MAFNDNVNSSGLVFESVGENQAISSSPTNNYNLLVGKWYDEGKHYELETRSCAAEESCHRYLQVYASLQLISKPLKFVFVFFSTADLGCDNRYWMCCQEV